MSKNEKKLEQALRGVASRHRLAILDAMLGGARSPVEATDATGMQLGNVSYHVRMLETAGLVRLTGTRPARGALEHFYEVTDLGRAAREAAKVLEQFEERKR